MTKILLFQRGDPLVSDITSSIQASIEWKARFTIFIKEFKLCKDKIFFMLALTGAQFVNLLVAISIAIPAIFLYQKYRITEIGDYLLFAGVFIVSSIAAIASVFAVSTNSLLAYQINSGLINAAFLLNFFHALRLKYEKPPVSLIAIGLGYFILLTGLILFWDIQTQPEEAFVLFTTMAASSSPAHPLGAGLAFGDTIIYSTSFYILGLIFWIFVSFVDVWAYTTVDLANPTDRIIKARKLWLFTWGGYLVWSVLLLPVFPASDIITVLLLIPNILIIYIALRYPESLLMSNDQLVRAQGLFDKIQSMEEDDDEETQSLGMGSLVTYLQSLPDDLRAETKISTP